MATDPAPDGRCRARGRSPNSGRRGADPDLDRVDVVGGGAHRLVRRESDLRGDQELVRAQVESLDVDELLDFRALQDRVHDPVVVGLARALADEQALGLDPEHDRDEHQQQADHERAESVEHRVPGDHRETDAEQGEDETGKRPGVLQQHDGKLGRLRMPDEQHPGLSLRADVVALHDGGAQRERLERDRDDQHRDRQPPPGLIQLVRVDQLLHALVHREHAADGEQDDRDDERVHEPFAAVAEGMCAVRAPPRLAPAAHEQQLVAGVGDRVDRLGEHRCGSGEQPRDDLRERDPQVRQQRRQDRPIATGCTHATSLCRTDSVVWRHGRCSPLCRVPRCRFHGRGDPARPRRQRDSGRGRHHRHQSHRRAGCRARRSRGRALDRAGTGSGRQRPGRSIAHRRRRREAGHGAGSARRDRPAPPRRRDRRERRRRCHPGDVRPGARSRGERAARDAEHPGHGRPRGHGARRGGRRHRRGAGARA